MHKVLRDNMKGDFNPKSPENARAIENLSGNCLWSMKSLEENHIVLFSSENFCIGNISSINYFLGTDYQDDTLFLHNVFNYYMEFLGKALVECEDQKMP